jgi:hypothetical protein
MHLCDSHCPRVTTVEANRSIRRTVLLRTSMVVSNRPWEVHQSDSARINPAGSRAHWQDLIPQRQHPRGLHSRAGWRISLARRRTGRVYMWTLRLPLAAQTPTTKAVLHRPRRKLHSAPPCSRDLTPGTCVRILNARAQDRLHLPQRRSRSVSAPGQLAFSHRNPSVYRSGWRRQLQKMKRTTTNLRQCL